MFLFSLTAAASNSIYLYIVKWIVDIPVSNPFLIYPELVYELKLKVAFLVRCSMYE